VSPEFISGIHSAGLNVLDSDKLIASHSRRDAGNGSQLKQAGYDPDPDKLIAMRIHGATPEWVEQLKKQGSHLDLDKLIASGFMECHRILSPLQSWVYAHPEADQLIAMRIME